MTCRHWKDGIMHTLLGISLRRLYSSNSLEETLSLFCSIRLVQPKEGDSLNKAHNNPALRSVFPICFRDAYGAMKVMLLEWI